MYICKDGRLYYKTSTLFLCTMLTCPLYKHPLLSRDFNFYSHLSFIENKFEILQFTNKLLFFAHNSSKATHKENSPMFYIKNLGWGKNH